nr:hypothetical protein [Planosporangium flavigriseum]
MSLFGVEGRPASPLDFEGLLAGAGQVVRMGGTARVSIVVDQPWRARALLAEASARGLAATCERVTGERATGEPGGVDGHICFRTAYSSALAALGASWLRGAVKHPPPGFALDGRRLRLWAIAAGERDGASAFALKLGVSDEPMWGVVGAALAAVGLPPVLLGPRAGGPAYRIVGRRRLARLIELVGDPPAGVTGENWI